MTQVKRGRGRLRAIVRGIGFANNQGRGRQHNKAQNEERMVIFLSEERFEPLQAHDTPYMTQKNCLSQRSSSSPSKGRKEANLLQHHSEVGENCHR